MTEHGNEHTATAAGEDPVVGLTEPEHVSTKLLEAQHVTTVAGEHHDVGSADHEHDSTKLPETQQVTTATGEHHDVGLTEPEHVSTKLPETQHVTTVAGEHHDVGSADHEHDSTKLPETQQVTTATGEHHDVGLTDHEHDSTKLPETQHAAEEHHGGALTDRGQDTSVHPETDSRYDRHVRRKCIKAHHEGEVEEEEDEEEEEDDCYTDDDEIEPSIDENTLVAAAVIHSGCHLNRDSLLINLKKVQTFVAETDAASRTDVRFLKRLGEMVGVLNADMDNLRAYCERATLQLETVREPIKDLTGKIFQKLPSEVEAEAARVAHEATAQVAPSAAVQTPAGDETEPAPEAEIQEEDVVKEKDKSLAELELDLHHKNMQHQLAKINNQLLLMAKLTVETEVAVVDANLVFMEAAEIARLLQLELEEQHQAELEEEQRLLELERLEQERLKLEEEKRLAQQKLDEELMRLRELEAHQWPIQLYESEKESDFDGGILCLIRADPDYFIPSELLDCNVVDLLDADYKFVENEELIGHIVKLTLKAERTRVKCPITVFIPHCMTRQQLVVREPIIKLEVEPGDWVEIPNCKDTTVDGYKETRFVTAQIRTFTRLIVVSRFRKELLKFRKKRGGKITSSVDPRVSLFTEPQMFPKKEKISIQMQPVDTVSLNELKRIIPEAVKGLLSISAIFNLEWTNREFTKPIVMTLPVPANPITLKKLADQAAAKESKDVKVEDVEKLEDGDPKEDRKKKEEPKIEELSKKDAGLPASWFKPVKWFLGQYAKESGDERDILYFMRKTPESQTWTVEKIQLEQIRLDAVELTLTEALDKFVVVRTSILISERDVERMMKQLDEILSHRICCMILKQMGEDACNVRLFVVPAVKKDRIVKKLLDFGYDEGPDPSTTFILAEGDLLDVTYRGNIHCVDDDFVHRAVFTTNLETSFSMRVSENDIFVQKSYDVYRGLVEIRSVVYIPIPPPPPKPPKAKKAAAVVHGDVDDDDDGDGEPFDAPPHVVEDESESEDEEEEEQEQEDLIPQPLFEIKYTKLAELLLTFPKDVELLSSKLLKKAPITYKPTNEPVTQDLLTQLAMSLGPEWINVAYDLGVNRSEVAMLQRNAELEDRPVTVVIIQVLDMWVKKSSKGEDKTNTLCRSLVKYGRRDLCEIVRVTKSLFEPGKPASLAKLLVEESGKVSRGNQVRMK